ncbi:hypothetical protein G7Y89_g14901 [Cudoniella acicularis]|uniref:Uncharacterized protein n=1 Tax=Cudoniella acicularis TaxID=354080 RepID=A0A8H4VQJ1_9HELO|nr:hypothetical protein G7Y89_g14901 [Cudoniella acicularis]
MLSALADALGLLGYKKVYHMRDVGKNQHQTKWIEALEAKFEGKGKDFGREEFDSFLSDYDCLSDYPAAIFPVELINAYPNAKIILTVRDEDLWYKSMMSTLWHQWSAPNPQPSPMRALSDKYHNLIWNGEFPKYGRQQFHEHNALVRSVAPKDRQITQFDRQYQSATMRLSQTPPSLLSLLLVALSNIETTHAWPLLGSLDFNFLAGRTTCASYCGAQYQFCCLSGESCTTNAANVASCVAATGGSEGGYAVYTTTWTETDLVLRTSTYSSYWASATAVASTVVSVATAAPSCITNLGETSCGSICCASDQNCAFAGSCTARPSSQGYGYGASSTYSAPLRPTSGGVVTATPSATTTQPFIAPATASGSTLPIASSGSSGLSSGAIAGIVIGTIAGVILLLVICFCCIVKAGWDGLLAIFGLGGRRRRDTERVEVIEERYSRHGSGTASRRQTHSGWFGGGGGRASRVSETRKKKSSGFGGLGAIGAGLLALAVILGLKRKSGEKEKPARSEISSSYYSYEDSYTGSSPTPAQMIEERDNREDREAPELHDPRGDRLYILLTTKI